MGGVRGRIVHAKIVDTGEPGLTPTSRLGSMPFTVPREAPVCYPPTSQNRAVITHGQGSWARLQYRRLCPHYNAPRCKSQDLPPDEGYAFRARRKGATSRLARRQLQYSSMLHCIQTCLSGCTSVAVNDEGNHPRVRVGEQLRVTLSSRATLTSGQG
jgi:hypothetical protein